MDLFKFGLRNVLGIMLPGTVLVLVFLYVLFSVLFVFGLPLTVFEWAKDQEFLVFLVLFLVCYFFGSMMRLNAADEVDRKSQQYLLKEWRSREHYSPDEEKHFEQVRQELLTGDRSLETLEGMPEGFDSWIWKTERFPYPLWQFMKFRLYHPDEVYRFYHTYRSCMGIGPQALIRRRGKEFFNYCKMVVCQGSGELGNALLHEVHLTEATVRFYAGTYYGLSISLFILLLLFCLQSTVVLFSFSMQVECYLKLINVVVNGALVAAMYLMQRTLVRRFRTLRLKDVDTVYDAFYLIHRHADNCPICSKAKDDGPIT